MTKSTFQNSNRQGKSSGGPQDPHRRLLLQALGAAGISTIFWNSDILKNGSAQAQAQSTVKKKFLIYVHCGSWDGWAAGLLQPRDVGKFPRGVFKQNVDVGSNNPNINEHHKSGNLILNNYSKVLESIADDVCFAAGTSRSVGHEEARFFQTTGEKVMGPSGNPAWVAGVAQATHGDSATASIVVNDAQLTPKTPQVTTLSGGNIDDFRNKFRDNQDIVNASGGSTEQKAAAKEFWTTLKSLHGRQFNAAPLPATTTGAAVSSIDSILNGLPELDANSPTVQDVNSNISRAKVDALLTQLDDGAATVNPPGGPYNHSKYDNLLSQLQLAALLAKTGKASGMVVNMDGQDLHGGGSSIQTARSACQLFAQLTVFWQWIKANQMQDDVMVIVSHEFSRTAYNTTPGETSNVMFKGVSTPVQSPGVDHHLAMGMVFLNGKVPSQGRVGGIGDTYIAAGSPDLKGIADPNIAAFTSTQLVGSMLMRVWGDVFPNSREIGKYWLGFTDSDVIKMVVS